MSISRGTALDRRTFLMRGASCGAYVLALAEFAPSFTRRVFAARSDREIVTEEAWGRIEKIDDGVWALVSTPFDGDYRTVCNGGIIQGDDRVLAVEAFMEADGARWFAEWARRLTGKWPTQVAVTHYHADHSAGDAGYRHEDSRPPILATPTTHRAVNEDRKERDEGLADWTDVRPVDESEPSEIDLGGRTVRIVPRAGHTSSDLTIELTEPSVVWCGDLMFNGMVPNYRDSQPARLSRDVAALLREQETVYVPGHGPLADLEEMNRYQDFLNAMEGAIRSAHRAGRSAEQAAEEFVLPEPFGDWYVFSPQVIPAAVDAWYREFANE